MFSEESSARCLVFLIISAPLSVAIPSIIICSIIINDYIIINNYTDAICILTSPLNLITIFGGAKGKISVNYTINNATQSGFVFYPPTHYPYLILRNDSEVRHWFAKLNGTLFNCMMNTAKHEGVSSNISNITGYIYWLVLVVVIWLLCIGITWLFCGFCSHYIRIFNNLRNTYMPLFSI